MTTMSSQVEHKLRETLSPTVLEVINESSMHSVPRGSETHFKVVVVSERFVDKRSLERHRMVNHILMEELRHGIHALSIQAFTPEEWAMRGHTVTPSPPCLGGSKAT